MSNRPIRSVLLTGAAIFAVTVGVVLAPTGAMADTPTIATDTIEWYVVDDTTGYIEDAQTYDFANDTYGWNSDAFDGLPASFTLHDTDQGDWAFVATTSLSDIHQGGTSVITMTGETTGWADPYTVVLTLTLKGNYAHWSYVMTNPTIGLANSSVTFAGSLGSDGDSVYAVSGSTLVSDDAGFGDPVIGYNVVTNGAFSGWTATNGDDQPIADASAAGTFDVYLVLYGYTPCGNGFADAKAAVTALVPTLPSTFGASYGQTGVCLNVAPLSFTAGVAVNQVLAYTVDPELTATGFFAGDVHTIVEGLPAGLTGVGVQQPDGSVVVTITGTPTATGTVTARLLFFRSGEGPNDQEVFGDASITVTAPVLAATGTELAGPIGLAGLLLAAGLSLGLAAAKRRLA